MTDFIEILQKAKTDAAMTALLDLHDYASDVQVYLKCSSNDIGERLEQRIRDRYVKANAVVQLMYRLCIHWPDYARSFMVFVHDSYEMCDDERDVADLEHRIARCRVFLAANTVTIKDH